MWILKLKGKVSATSDLNVYGTVPRNSEHREEGLQVSLWQ